MLDAPYGFVNGTPSVTKERLPFSDGYDAASATRTELNHVSSIMLYFTGCSIQVCILTT